MLDIPSYNPAPVSIPATSENPQNANFALTEFSEVRMYRILGSPMLGVLRFVGHDDYFHKPPDS
jgi:hypothetical protein